MSDADATANFIPFLGITGVVKDRFLDKVVDVEFECGECCKKVFGGRLALIGNDFILLSQVHLSKPILVKAFSAGKLVVKEFVESIIIPFDRVCSIEIRAKIC